MGDRGPFRSRQTLGWAAALFLLNAFICRELFFTEYTIHLGSIEAAYIGISRYAIDHPFQWDWFPLWYGGIPYNNTYPPLLHLLVALVAWLAGISPALSHHAVTAALYCLSPVTIYLLALVFSRRHVPGVLAALFYSLSSPSVAIVQQFQAWIDSPWKPLRLSALLEYGDGPHIAAVTLLPLAVLALHYALERRRPFAVYLAAAALAAVVLTNWLGAFSLAVAAVSYLLARSSQPGWSRRVAWAAGIGVIAYGLAAPWIPPSNLSDIRYNAQHVIGRYPMTSKHFVYAAFVVALTALLWGLCRRWKPTLIVAFSAYLTLFFSALLLADDWLGIQLMPQPHRYHHEFEMAICLLAVFGAARLTRRLPPKWEAGLAGAIAVTLVVVQYGVFRRRALELIRPIDMSQTIEYQIPKWLGDHMPHERIFTSGAIQFWLAAFTDTQQLGGGFGQGIVNRQIPVVSYGIPWTRGDGALTAMWLRLYGAQAVVVAGPQSRDYYKQNWQDPAKLDGVLPELWRDGGDVIYAVPQRSSSLAHVILPEHVPYRSPENNLDIETVEPLAKALEDPSLPLADFAWTTASDARMQADLELDHLLFVQVTYHPGWRAYVNGEPRRIRREPLGMMVIEPRCEGPCEVTLSFDGGVEMLLARLLCALTILGGLVWLFYSQ
jgi:hypothetical protein